MKNSQSGSDSDAPKTDALCEHYEEIFARYDREFRPWLERGDKVYEIYTEQRKGALARDAKRMALLWSNINVLQPAVYSRMPLPTVTRRFRDPDPAARVASDLIERCLHYSFDTGNMDSVLRLVRDDGLIVARGAAWVRYEADFKAAEGAEVQTEGSEPDEVKADERVVWEYVHWKDFGHNVCRHWGEVNDVWKISYMTRKQLSARFSETLSEAEIKSIPLNFKPSGKGPHQDSKCQAIVYEVWSKAERKVAWIVRGFHKPLEVGDPPLNLTGFFPCPKPVYGTTESASLIPVPDYVFYQDQAEEIDELTARIASLTDALKMVGFYPADIDGDGQAAIEKAADPRVQNKLIAVKNWAAFADKGGGGAAIIWWPADVVAKTIRELISLRKEMMDDVYQVTGISDILRGDGQASETATAQNIKSQWGSMRIRDRQIVLAAFGRDLARIGGEIISEHFSPETLLRMSNLNLPTRAEVEKAQLRAQLEAEQAAMAQAQQAPPQGAPVPGGPM